MKEGALSLCGAHLARRAASSQDDSHACPCTTTSTLLSSARASPAPPPRSSRARGASRFYFSIRARSLPKPSRPTSCSPEGRRFSPPRCTRYAAATGRRAILLDAHLGPGFDYSARLDQSEDLRGLCLTRDKMDAAMIDAARSIECVAMREQFRVIDVDYRGWCDRRSSWRGFHWGAQTSALRW